MFNDDRTASTLAVREMLDRMAITELIYQYCRAVDRLDRELGAAIWHEGGEIDLGPLWRGTGRDWMNFTCDIHERQVLVHSHQITNVTIRVDGDQAGSEAYVTATVRMVEDGVLRQWTHWGRYLDQWAWREDRWGIETRQYVEDFAEVRDASPTGVEAGKRDRTDVAYAVLKGNTAASLPTRP